jgi:hypothetical protein
MKRTEIDETSQFRTSLRLTNEESWATASEEAGRREARRLKHCKLFFRIVTEYVNVPEHLQLHTRLPGDPRGDSTTGFCQFRRELLTIAMLDRAKGGHRLIHKIWAPTNQPS